MRLTLARILSLGAACLAFTTPAIELLNPVPLPDDGFGSDALGVVDKAAQDTGTINLLVGSKKTATGQQLPMIWSTDGSATVLPLPAGAEGEACAGRTYSDEDTAVIGNIWPANNPSLRRSVLWRKPSTGAWNMPQPLAPGSQVSNASRADGSDHPIEQLVVAGWRLEGGRWRAVLHFVTETQVVTQDLPAPPNSDSAAMAVDCSGPRAIAAGWATFPSGLRKPTVWIQNGEDWTATALQVPTSVSGALNDVVGFESGWVACGALVRNGRSTASIVKWEGPDFDATKNALWGQLPPDITPDGVYDNSSAETLGFKPTNDLSTVGQVFGVSWKTGDFDHHVATLWLDNEPVSVRQLLTDPNSVLAVTSFKPTGDITTVGQIVPRQPLGWDIHQACTFASTGTFVADRANCVDWGYHPGWITWHEDNLELLVPTRIHNGQRRAEVILECSITQPFVDGLGLEIVARCQDGSGTDNANFKRAGASGILAVSAYNFARADYCGNGFLSVTTDKTKHAIALCADSNPQDVIDPQTGSVRIRLEFIQNGKNPAALAVDMMQLHHQYPNGGNNLHGTSGTGEK